MKKLTIGLCILAFVFGLSAAAHAEFITVGSDSILTVDGAEYQLISAKPSSDGPEVPDGTGLMWEWNSTSTTWQACLCRLTAFRALQALETSLNLTTITSDQIDIVTGWNTHGPEEMYVDLMTWVENDNFSYAGDITPGADLTLDDAWFIFTIEGIGTYEVTSSAQNYAFEHDVDAAGYQADWDFFDYRRYVKNGGTGDESTYFSSVIRSQVVENLTGTTYFEVNAVPEPGSAVLMMFGLLGICGANRKWSKKQSSQA
ncbi:hypothetical protein DO021_21160 [Desulfobacter hydrogenophilus]|uniref:PEP-CTERM sorting domain-containing protein n=1 Tax=Desulfobacter hydrogenophilus TaxID=2291 RepID=A0A328FAK0_9BACT|nr:PEP-CTERM sorting domain-containing protein [Desulfobacter hydrogenophilus]NDY71391.1 PEP-CTERM sorting domain-containing protein [Desulfobacter hydrogenophilus]QBH12131.1 PEP-CTERM sorting domain-containing protein [Desulfobacter hydrogenophilus]RAM00057.1 hypothetical protein DO021_21160 [Desulfobacter hydrogenophilus]